MAYQIKVARDETEVPINLVLNKGGPVTGATVVYAIRDADTPNSWLDFNDMTFKTAAWTTRQSSMTGSATQDGLYTAIPGPDLTAITNLPANTNHLIAEIEVTAPASVAGIAEDMILIEGNPWDIEVGSHLTADTTGEAIRNIAYHGVVHIDTVGGSAGTAYPIGTVNSPVDNMTDALTIAVALGIDDFVIAGNVTLGASFTNKCVTGISSNNLVAIINLGGQNVAGTTFDNIAITGTSTGFFTAHDCEFFGTLNGIQGIFVECTLLGTITPGANTSLWLMHCYSGIAGLSTPIIDLTNMTTGGDVSVRAYSGGLTVRNCNVGAFNSSFEYVAGQIILEATLTAGTFAVRGVVKITDSSAGATISTDAALERTAIQALILDDATPFSGADIPKLVNHSLGNSKIDTSGGPWILKIYEDGTPANLVASYDLLDQAGATINATNNPLLDPTIMLAARERI